MTTQGKEKIRKKILFDLIEPNGAKENSAEKFPSEDKRLSRNTKSRQAKKGKAYSCL